MIDNDKIISMKKVLLILSFSLTPIIIFSLLWFLIGPVGNSDKLEVFTVPQETGNFSVVDSLYEQKFIRNKSAFNFLLQNLARGKEVKSGGYRLSQKMNAWQVLEKITGKQDLFWLTISYCPRKEQVGEKLAQTLGWGQEQLNNWNSLYKKDNSEYFEGVYYPDTYMLPADESPEQISKRFLGNFNEKFAPLSDGFLAKNIKWTTGLKIASLIAREAAGAQDMKLISGIIWNRLNDGMPLQIDATMQYTLGKNEDGSWWGNIDISQKQSDSPYNSYKYKGLPPTPICSPSVTAIEAALNPEETDCLFYLHDSSSQIHCAKTYQEHLSNIRKYL